MKVLFIGDVVGPEATRYVAGRLQDLRQEHAPDLVIANAENCLVSGPRPENGFGMSPELVELLLESGADVITSGNHAWDGPEPEKVLSHPRVLRPHNLPEIYTGKGALSVETARGPVTIVNLVSRTAMPDALTLYGPWLSTAESGPVIVDLHGESVIEKQVFAHAVDGKVAAVLGTHTHEPTLPLHLLPGGTALVTDVGMTGPYGGVAGIASGHFLAKARGNGVDEPPPFELADAPVELGAVLLDLEGGETRSVARLH